VSSAVPRPYRPRPDWAAIETVCLDMDGTVLDLRFDNQFWLEALPRRWGAAHGIEPGEAIRRLRARFDAKRGTLEWYCIDHWSDELDFDIAALKREMRDSIRWLPGAERFLEAVRARGKRLLLTTNAHPISLDVKDRQAGLSKQFDELVSSHEFGVPKEDAQFWAMLADTHGVDPATTLFVDDSTAVLHAAREAAVREIYQVLRPDSTLPAREPLAGIASIDALADLVD